MFNYLLSTKHGFLVMIVFEEMERFFMHSLIVCHKKLNPVFQMYRCVQVSPGLQQLAAVWSKTLYNITLAVTAEC